VELAQSSARQERVLGVLFVYGLKIKFQSFH